MSSEPEDLEALLEAGGALPEGCFILAASPEAFRADLLTQTLRVVRRKRWKQRLRMAGGLAAAYLLGMSTLAIVRAPLDGPTVATESSVVEPVTVRAYADKPVREPAKRESARALRIAAAYAPFDQRASLLRQAGDLYLMEEGDVERALQCYREYLNELDHEKLSKRAGDENWLLLSLRQARLQEIHHEG